ncbi:MAG: ABC transporter permease subunit [Verrucomicrobiales bacterium]|nr:ABC transporter permease subunit [Verrucomicrobiales bacterium]
MTTVVVHRREIRLSLWNLALLLPVLPWLGLVYPTEGIDPGARVGSVVALFALGLLVGLGLPYFLEHGSPVWRKEADPFRVPWLVSLFAVQAPLLAGDNSGIQIAMILLALSACLLGAIPFGYEFHHGTMGGLLSQPIDRRETWWRKMGLLAGALGSLTLVFTFSLTARTGELHLDLGLWLLALAIMAWGTTTTWTLVTRGLLPGMIFSLAAPLTVILGLGLVLDLNFPAPEEIWPWAIGYGLVGLAFGNRCWHRLEAIESTGSERTGVFLPSLVRSSTTSAPTRSPTISTIIKELRLQTVTVLNLLFAVGFAAARPWLQNWEWAFAVSLLFAFTTVLLAATTMVAEERRLGTLDQLLVLPASKTRQWSIKIGIAAGLALIALVSLMLPDVTNGGLPGGTARDWHGVLGQILDVGLIGLAFFAIGCLASTTSRTTLSALVNTLAVFLVAFWIVMAAGNLLGPDAARQHAQVNAYSEHGALRQKAATLSDADLSRLQVKLDWMNWGGSRWVTVLPAVLGAAAALSMARRNFLRPPSGLARWSRQASVSLGLVGALTFTGAAIDTLVTRAQSEAHWLMRAAEVQRLLLQLSPGQQELWERHRTDAFDMEIMVRVFDDRPGIHKDVGVAFTLPLNRAGRRLVVEQGRISENLRAVLRSEAASEGDVITGSPPPEPAPPPIDDPLRARRLGNPLPPPNLLNGTILMRRYGLMAPSKATNRPTATNTDKAP